MIEKKYSKILDICYKRLNEVGIDPKYVERYKSINIETLGDLFLTTEREIRRTQRIPAKGLYQAKKAMEVHGLILKEK